MMFKVEIILVLFLITTPGAAEVDRTSADYKAGYYDGAAKFYFVGQMVGGLDVYQMIISTFDSMASTETDMTLRIFGAVVFNMLADEYNEMVCDYNSIYVDVNADVCKTLGDDYPGKDNLILPARIPIKNAV